MPRTGCKNAFRMWVGSLGPKGGFSAGMNLWVTQGNRENDLAKHMRSVLLNNMGMLESVGGYSVTHHVGQSMQNLW